MDNGVYTERLEAKETFSLIMMHPSEQAANNGKWDELIESFVVHDIGKYLHMSFMEWVHQPNDLVTKQIKAAIRWKQRELKDASNQLSSIVDLTGAPIKKQ